LKFPILFKDWEQRKNEFLLKAYWSQLSKEEYQLLHSLPEMIVGKPSVGYLYFYDKVYENISVSLTSYVMNANGQQYNMREHNVAKHIYQEYIALSKEKEKLDAEVESFKAQVWSVLNSVTTVNKLKELWVEISDIVDRNINPNISQSTYLPATTIAQLNKSIPLPQ